MECFRNCRKTSRRCKRGGTGGGVTSTAVTNEELFAAYLSGDGNALHTLMERHGDALTLYINGYIYDIHEAEDLMIEAFSRMISAKPRLVKTGLRPTCIKPPGTLPCGMRKSAAATAFLALRAWKTNWKAKCLWKRSCNPKKKSASCENA